MNTEQKVVLGGIAFTIVLFVGAVVFLGGEKTPKISLQEIIGESGVVAGTTMASVVLAEFSDFQCPACAAVHPTLKKILADYSGQTAFYYRHFPIVPPHQNAYLAAYAAEAAREQGKFLGVHDWLFENQKSWESENVSGEYFYEQFGQDLALDKETFLVDFTSNEVRARVNQDFSDGRRLEVNSTPTFFINGKKLVGAQSYETFKKEIEEALVK